MRARTRARKRRRIEEEEGEEEAGEKSERERERAETEEATIKMKNDVLADIPATISLTPLGSYMPPLRTSKQSPLCDPLGIIGDFLNLLNRPLNRSRVPLPLLFFSLFLPSFSFFLRTVLFCLSPTRSVEFHPNGGLSLSTLGAAVRPDEGLGFAPGDRLAPCYLFFELFALRPPPEPHTPFISAQTAAMRNTVVIEILEKSCVNLAS